jgi:hypothetical protein
MKKLFYLALVSILAQCHNDRVKLNGHYVSASKSDYGYETLDILDSVIIVNKSLVFAEARDTIIIDPTTNSFVSSTREMFPSFGVSYSKDTVILDYTHDAGDDQAKFVKAPPSSRDYFSTSCIDIELTEYEDEAKFDISQSKIRNITVGTLKRDLAAYVPDSIYLEYESEQFLSNSDLLRIGQGLDREQTMNWVLCLSIDTRVPDSVSERLRSMIGRSVGFERLVETRISNGVLVYVKRPAVDPANPEVEIDSASLKVSSNQVFVLAQDYFDCEATAECDCCSGELYILSSDRFALVDRCLSGDTYFKGVYSVEGRKLTLAFDRQFMNEEVDDDYNVTGYKNRELDIQSVVFNLMSCNSQLRLVNNKEVTDWKNGSRYGFMKEKQRMADLRQSKPWKKLME